MKTSESFTLMHLVFQGRSVVDPSVTRNPALATRELEQCQLIHVSSLILMCFLNCPCFIVTIFSVNCVALSLKYV